MINRRGFLAGSAGALALGALERLWRCQRQESSKKSGDASKGDTGRDLDPGLRQARRRRAGPHRRVQERLPEGRAQHQRGRLRPAAVPVGGRERQPAGPGLPRPRPGRHLRRQGRHPAAGRPDLGAAGLDDQPLPPGRRCKRGDGRRQGLRHPGVLQHPQHPHERQGAAGARDSPRPTVGTTDWNKLHTNAAKLYKASGGKISRIGFDPKLPEFLPLWAKANGADLVNPDGSPNLDDPKIIEALTYALSLIDEQGGWSKFKAFRDTWDLFGSGNEFEKDQAGAFPWEGWYVNVLVQSSPKLELQSMPFTDRQGKPDELLRRQRVVPAEGRQEPRGGHQLDEDRDQHRHLAEGRRGARGDGGEEQVHLHRPVDRQPRAPTPRSRRSTSSPARPASTRRSRTTTPPPSTPSRSPPPRPAARSRPPGPTRSTASCPASRSPTRR